MAVTVAKRCDMIERRTLRCQLRCERILSFFLQFILFAIYLSEVTIACIVVTCILRFHYLRSLALGPEGKWITLTSEQKDRERLRGRDSAKSRDNAVSVIPDRCSDWIMKFQIINES